MDENFNINDELMNSKELLNNNIQGNQNISNQNFTNSLSLSVVKSISGWGMFRAVLDIISGGLSCLGGIIFLLFSLVIFASGNSANKTMSLYGGLNGISAEGLKILGGLFLVSAFIYPVIGVLRIIYSINLIKAIDNLKKAIALNNESCIIEFLNKLSRFFKFNGIVSILKISLYILLIIFYIILIIISISSFGSGNFMNEINNNISSFQ